MSVLKYGSVALWDPHSLQEDINKLEKKNQQQGIGPLFDTNDCVSKKWIYKNNASQEHLPSSQRKD